MHFYGSKVHKEIEILEIFIRVQNIVKRKNSHSFFIEFLFFISFFLAWLKSCEKKIYVLIPCWYSKVLMISCWLCICISYSYSIRYCYWILKDIFCLFLYKKLDICLLVLVFMKPEKNWYMNGKILVVSISFWFYRLIIDFWFFYSNRFIDIHYFCYKR